MVQPLIFTDLDGTLLDHDTYSYEEASYAIDFLRKEKIPWVMCTSKTRAEINFWRKKIGNRHPFISENGGGIFIPKNYFDFQFNFDREERDLLVVELGCKYEELLKAIKVLKSEYRIKSLIDMDVSEIVEDLGLDEKQAELARKREYDIPFRILGEDEKKDILDEIKDMELHFTSGGRYYHLTGGNDKGQAVDILSDLYKKKYGEIYTIGIGDSYNDFSMLDAVDEGYLVERKKEGYASDKYKKAGGVGPAGWKKVVFKEFKK
ncbi:MAG: HAD-IIB family hydrolase [Candidatus Thermoplasmatota archaeon]